MPLACCHASCWPLVPCDVRGVMRSAPLRSVPPLHSPPSWVLPKGSPPCRPHFALPRSHKYPPAQASHAPARIPGSLSLASSDRSTPHARRAAVSACPRFRSASPPPVSPSTPRHEDAPRPGLRPRVRAAPHASGPCKDRRHGAEGIALRECRSCRRHRWLALPPPGADGVKCCPRHSRRFRVRASLVQLGRFCGIT